MQIDLEDDVVLITGSTRGIGRAVALQMADHGADVVINGRSEKPAEELLPELEARGADAMFVPADLNEPDEVQAMVDTVIDEMGGVDVLVGSGGGISGPLTDFFRNLDPVDFIDFARSRYLVRMYAVHAVLEPMIEAGGGRIINITSDAGRYPTPGEVFPGGGGAAVIMSSRALASEFSRWNINVNTVSISVTEETAGLDWVLEEGPAASVFEHALEEQDFSVSSEDIAETILFLAGAEGAKAMTGQVISVNGGISY